MAARSTELSPDVLGQYLFLLVIHGAFSCPPDGRAVASVGRGTLTAWAQIGTASGVVELELPSPFSARIGLYCSHLT